MTFSTALKPLLRWGSKMREASHGGGGLVQRFYDDWYEAIDIALNEARIREEGGWHKGEGLRSRNEAERRKNDSSWILGCSFSDIKRILLSDGWQEGVDKIKPICDGIYGEISNSMVNQQVHYDVCGASIDIGAFVTGQPECCLNFREEERVGAGKVLSLIANIGADRSVNAQKMFLRGAVVVALVDLLEMSGYRVEVSVANGIRHFIRGEYLIPVKSAIDSVSRERLVFALCHPAMLRVVVLSLMESMPRSFREEANITHTTGYGGPCPLSMIGYTADIAIPNAESTNFLSASSAKAWVIAELKKQGIEVKEKAA